MTDPHDIEDVSDEEAAEELGYADVDWSKLPIRSVERHDEILEMELDALEALAIDELDDLGKWAAAQGFADFEMYDRFQDICVRIVRSEKPHKAIEYADIAMELFHDYLLEESWDDAVFLLPDLERLLPDDPMARARLGALINVLRGRVDDGLAVFQELAEEYQDDALCLLVLAEDLIGCQRFVEATSLLEKAEEVAEIEGDEETLEGVAAARAYLAEQQEGSAGK